MSQFAGKNSTQYQAGRDINIKNESKPTRLSALFDKLNSEFNDNNQITEIIDELESFTKDRDIIGLEQKMIDGNKEHLFEDVSWMKQEYSKKLRKFRFYNSAQKIHSIVLAAVLEKFWNNVSPLIRKNADEEIVLKTISEKVIDPIFRLIEEEGCEDIMGLTKSDINGMIYYLTGKCHIKWT